MFSEQYPDALNWNRLETLAREKASLGCYVTGHPLDRYGHKLRKLDVTTTKELANRDPWTMARVAGMVENYQEKIFRSGGGKAAFFVLEDLHGRVNAKIRGDKIEECATLLKQGEPIIVTGKVTFPQTDEDEGDAEPSLLVDSVEHLGAAVQRVTRTITVNVVSASTNKDTWQKLNEVVRGCPGDCDIEFVVRLNSGVDVVLGLDCSRVCADDGLIGALEQVVGYSAVELR